jgi:hypothetical protein
MMRDACRRCGGPATLGRRLDGAGWRAVAWCQRCEGLAHGDDSFLKCHPDALAGLPIVGEGKQGSLF